MLTERQKYLFELSRKGDAASIAKFIREAVNDRLNFLIVGGTGSGKTTVGKAIADLFPPERRYATIEDVHEMTLPNHPNHIHLFYKRELWMPSRLLKPVCALNQIISFWLS